MPVQVVPEVQRQIQALHARPDSTLKVQALGRPTPRLLRIDLFWLQANRRLGESAGMTSTFPPLPHQPGRLAVVIADCSLFGDFDPLRRLKIRSSLWRKKADRVGWGYFERQLMSETEAIYLGLVIGAVHGLLWPLIIGPGVGCLVACLFGLASAWALSKLIRD